MNPPSRIDTIEPFLHGVVLEVENLVVVTHIPCLDKIHGSSLFRNLAFNEPVNKHFPRGQIILGQAQDSVLRLFESVGGEGSLEVV